MLDVLFRNDDILVLDKPAGLAVQPGAGVRTSLVEAVEKQFGFRPFLIHRLDRDTAGCIAVAASSQAASRYSALLADKGRALKVYRALAAGVPDARSGIIRDAIEVRGERKEAETRWRLLASGSGFSLLELELGTGRMHQIRLHLAGCGHPILGDDRHGDFALNKRLSKEYRLKRLLLYAVRLELPSDPPVRAEAPVPPHFRAFLAALDDPDLSAAAGIRPDVPGTGSAEAAG